MCLMCVLDVHKYRLSFKMTLKGLITDLHKMLAHNIFEDLSRLLSYLSSISIILIHFVIFLIELINIKRSFKPKKTEYKLIYLTKTDLKIVKYNRITQSPAGLWLNPR